MVTTLVFHGQPVYDMGTYWTVVIRKPIYGTCIMVNEKIVRKANQAGVDLLLQCPGGEERISPSDLKKKAKLVEKVFKQPNNPMKLYQYTIQPIEKSLD